MTQRERITVETVENALKAQAWEAATDLAERALAQRKWTKTEEAFLYFARTRSLSNLNQYTAALDPGQRAVTLAEQAKAWDLLGLSLIELAWVQRKIESLQSQALGTITRYFEFFTRYGQEARSRYLLAMFSKGVYLRVAGFHSDAMNQFKATYDEAIKRRDAAWAERARGNAVYEALLLRRLDVAEPMIKLGDDYLSSHPGDDEAVSSHLIDHAQLLLLKGDLPGAKGKAQEAYDRARKKHPALASQAFDLLQQISGAEGNNDAALRVAVLAKIYAEEDERHDLVDKLGNAIQEIALRDPDAAERFIRSLAQSE